MYRYETHCHTAPVSKCAKATVRETLEFYKRLDYTGVFITNHFWDGNINIDRSLPYEERIAFYFSDYEEGIAIGKEIGIDVFCGVEMSYGGTDFLIYGLTKDWWLSHPELEGMKKSQQLSMLMESGALVIQAHPYREAHYIDHIRLFPRHVHGVETINSSASDFVNEMAAHYADAYKLLHFAGSDNHSAANREKLAGMEFETPLISEQDFVRRFLQAEGICFRLTNPQ